MNADFINRMRSSRGADESPAPAPQPRRVTFKQPARPVPVEEANNHSRHPAEGKENGPTQSAVEAEKAILACVLWSPSRWHDINRHFGASGIPFEDPKNIAVYRAMAEAVDFGDPIDDVVINHRLAGKGYLDLVVDGYVTLLRTSPGDPAHLDSYLGAVRDKSLLRGALARVSSLITDLVPGKTNSQSATSLIEVSEDLAATARSLRGGSNFPAPVDASIFMEPGMMPPEPDMVVKGLLHRESKMIIGGMSKGRKTWSLVDLAVSVATGTPWWGLETWKGRVCYINFEIQQPFFLRRVDWICRHKEIKLDPKMLTVWTLRGHLQGIEHMSAEIIRQLSYEDMVLLIVDPIYKALGDRDENKAGDVASMLNELERICVRTKSAIAYGAHFSKGNQSAKDPMDRIGGSGVFSRDSDTILTMTEHEEPDHYTVTSVLRNFAPVDPFVVEWEFPVFERTELDPTKLKKPKEGNKDKYSHDDILKHLSATVPMTTTAIKKIVEAEEGISRSTFFRLWPAIKSAQKVHAVHGGWLIGGKQK